MSNPIESPAIILLISIAAVIGAIFFSWSVKNPILCIDPINSINYSRTAISLQCMAALLFITRQLWTKGYSDRLKYIKELEADELIAVNKITYDTFSESQSRDNKVKHASIIKEITEEEDNISKEESVHMNQTYLGIIVYFIGSFMQLMVLGC